MIGRQDPNENPNEGSNTDQNKPKSNFTTKNIGIALVVLALSVVGILYVIGVFGGSNKEDNNIYTPDTSDSENPDTDTSNINAPDTENPDTDTPDTDTYNINAPDIYAPNYSPIAAPVSTAPVSTSPVSTAPVATNVPKNWKGYSYSTTITSGGRRCGPNFNNTACPNNQCCSSLGYCGGTTGDASAWCFSVNGWNGHYNDKEPVAYTSVASTPVGQASLAIANTLKQFPSFGFPLPVSTAPVSTAPVSTAPVPTAPVPTAPVSTAPVPTAPVPKNWKGYSYSTTIESGGRRCGPNFNNTACPDNQCCSSVGYCGGATGGNDAYCTGSMSGGNYNDKEPKNWKGYSYSTNDRCGPDFNNTACPDNKCCSTANYCGGSTGGDDAWCSTSQLYGKFNHKEPTATIHGVIVKEIVLLNKHAQPIYIEPYVFKRIINDNSIDTDDLDDLSCNGDEYNAVNAYNISSNRFDELKTSSQNMQQKYTFATEFIREDGAIHNNSDKLHGCTQFWNLYSEGRYTTEKNNLINAGFKYFSPNNANDAKNWLRDSVGASRYSRYWKVFYR